MTIFSTNNMGEKLKNVRTKTFEIRFVGYSF